MYIHGYIYIHIYTCIYIYIYTYKYTYVYTYIYIYTYIQQGGSTYTYVAHTYITDASVYIHRGLQQKRY